MSENGTIHITMMKNWVSHNLFLIIYLAALKKGAIRYGHPYYAIYRLIPPTPHPRIISKTDEYMDVRNNIPL